ncbi:MAG: hypothetical protein IT172_05650 [Acidobacteria bacterium]|nr:hypothetical protein [Acidobacteriota bacterium]
MKRLLLAVFAVAVLAAMPPTLRAQNYGVPNEVATAARVKQAFPQYFGSRFAFPQLEAEKFFPIGWSRSGNFAYLVEPVDEACGCYFAKLVIQNMRTDEVLWKFEFNEGDNNAKNAPKNLRTLWAKNRRLFSQKLAKHGIVASRSVLLGKSFTFGGSSFTAALTKQSGKNEDGEDSRVNLYSVLMTSPKLGTKTLFTSEDHTSDDYWFMLDAGMIGSVKSPYQSRVAVVAAEVWRGYEGPPHVVRLRIVGSDLTSGFKK